MTVRPRIGLTMRAEAETRRFYLGRDYCEAVEASGGVPVHIPLIPDEGYIREVVGGLDGILLPGCDSDVDPIHYGEDPHPALGRVVAEKDATDLLVLDEVERRRLPLLAICYGMQILNVHRGGSLIQDITSQVEGCVQHQQRGSVERNSHVIKVRDEASVHGVFDSVTSKGGEAKVNSHHHQAVKKVGNNLRAIAWANDGIIEGITDTRPEHFAMGLQWHPELSWMGDVLSRRIFEVFVERCSLGMNGRMPDPLEADGVPLVFR